MAAIGDITSDSDPISTKLAELVTARRVMAEPSPLVLAPSSQRVPSARPMVGRRREVMTNDVTPCAYGGRRG